MATFLIISHSTITSSEELSSIPADRV